MHFNLTYLAFSYLIRVRAYVIYKFFLACFIICVRVFACVCAFVCIFFSVEILRFRECLLLLLLMVVVLESPLTTLFAAAVLHFICSTAKCTEGEYSHTI